MARSARASVVCGAMGSGTTPDGALGRIFQHDTGFEQLFAHTVGGGKVFGFAGIQALLNTRFDLLGRQTISICTGCAL